MFYLSLNSVELGILLSQATGDETQLYIALRKFADFKTGEMAHPAAGRLNLAYLARMLSRDARQGRKATTMHREDIRRGLERLAVLGLLVDLGRKGGALTMRLPLVGLELDAASQPGKDKSCTHARGKAERSRGRSTVGECSGILATTDIDGELGESSGGKMCGIPLEKSSKPCGTANAKNGKPLVRQGLAGGRNSSFSTQTKTSVTHVNPESDIQPAAVNPITPPAAAGGKDPEKPETRFRDIVADESDGAIRYLDSEKSKGIYKSWIFAKVDEQDLREAVRQVISDISRQPTPDSIDAALRLRHAPKRDTTKGRLAL